MKIIFFHTSLEEGALLHICQDIKKFFIESRLNNLQSLSIVSKFADCCVIADQVCMNLYGNSKHRWDQKGVTALTPFSMAKDILQGGHTIVLATIHYEKSGFMDLLKCLDSDDEFIDSVIKIDLSKEIVCLNTESKKGFVFK